MRPARRAGNIGTMRRLLAPLLLLVPLTATAGSDPRFSELREQAEAVGSLSAFLDKYVGECTDLFASGQCKANAKAFRQKVNGKKFYMIVSEDHATMLAPGPYNPEGDYTVNIAPMFPAGGYAVTHGAPTKTDAHGNPVVMYVQARRKVPLGWNAMRFQNLFKNRALRVQVVFTPLGVWSLPKKGGGQQHGMRAKVDAVYVTIGRTGDPVALWLADKR
jgi:hypothetical protein